jgi:hypothetical protein
MTKVVASSGSCAGDKWIDIDAEGNVVGLTCAGWGPGGRFLRSAQRITFAHVPDSLSKGDFDLGAVPSPNGRPPSS